MPVNTIDNSPTVAFALGIDRPNVWVGKPIKTAFVGYDEEVAYTRKTFYRQPRVKPAGDGFRPSGGLYIGDETIVVIKNTAADATIHYTLNGGEPTSSSPVCKTPFKVRQTTTVRAALFIGGLWLQTYVEGPGFPRQVLTSDMPTASLSLHTTN